MLSSVNTRETRDDPFTPILARTLRHAHLDSGMTRKALAEEVGMGINTVTRYLEGQRPIPADYFFRMCRAMGVSAGAILEEAERALDEQTGRDA